MGHRYYDAGTGRFLTRDPKGYGGGINLYGFTGNNPVNESDADGLNPAGDRILKIARSKANSVRWADPPQGNGTGCSGFVSYCVHQAGFIPHIKKPSYAGQKIPTAMDWTTGNVIGWTKVANSQAQPGDIIAYKKIAHNGPHGAVSSTGHCGFFEGFATTYRIPIVNWWRDDGLDYVGSSGEPEKVNDERFNDDFGTSSDTGTYVTLRYTGAAPRASAPRHALRRRHE
jgi:uncharacterized protein RhaS with RHS repeats